MKQFITFTLSLILVISLVAGCGSTNKNETTAAPEAALPGSALEILETVWGSYGEDEKFSIMGGNMENAVMDAPGTYDLTYAENLTYNLLVPTDRIGNVDEVASMIHAMNANTFTCGAFHMAEGVSAQEFAGAMQEAVRGNMWMCGFPERLVIATVGSEYVIMAFGVNDAMTPYYAHLTENYAGAEIFCDEPIA